jgi:hypothetical protein
MRDRRFVARASCLAVHLTAVVLLVGCGPGDHTPAPAPDLDQAREVVARALDQWKNSVKVEDVAQLEPPMHVSDHDWSAGRQLVEYRVGETSLHGNNAKIAVALTLKLPQGGAKKTSATYLVSTQPVISIVRSDLDE